MEKAISIIIPVYNSEKYIGECIESILSQSYEDFELILVDDGSSDNSGLICEQYAAKDNRIQVVHKENGGLCSARNKGIELAQGEYLTFCDNDDIYLPGLLEDNIKLAKKYDADVVRFLRRRIAVFEDGTTQIQDGNMNEICKDSDVAVMQNDEIIKNYALLKKVNAINTIWNGFYRKELVKHNKIEFDTRMKFGGEDILFNLQVLEKSKKHVFNNRVYYQYQKAFGRSTSTKFSYNRVEAMLIYSERERDFIKKYGLEEILWSNYQVTYFIKSAQLFNQKGCTWSSKEKNKRLRYLFDETVIGKDINGHQVKGLYKQLWTESKQRSIMAWLMEKHLYGLMRLMIKVYDIIPSHKSFGL